MKLGIISGSGLYDFEGVAAVEETEVTPFGSVAVAVGALGRHDVVWISRHGPGHRRLSNHVTHRANIQAMRARNVQAIVGVTAVGVIDPSLPLARPIVFDDVFFPSNRLPEGDLATYFLRPGDPLRGHWIPDRPFSPWLCGYLARAAADAGTPAVVGGCYVHADGPRFNTAAEHRWMRSVGGTAVSQTCGPEAVLAGELGLPYALVGFGVNHVTGVEGAGTEGDAGLEGLLARLRSSMVALVRALADVLPVDVEVPCEMGGVFRMGS
ncbi:MAG: MTAP family purine nucleoside phosphorylase [Acidobacteriota bacterium]